jgi:L-threonylcarbamoyladenylate synthase
VAAQRRYDLTGTGLDSETARYIGTALRAGEIIIYPTDTLYAVGCCALDRAAVTRLRRAKGREADKPLPLIVSDRIQARDLVSKWNETADRLADAFWPGPLTMVIPAIDTLPRELLSGGSTVAIRVPDSEVARALAGSAGPLVSTSANFAGEPPCVTIDQALTAFPLAGIAIDVGRLDGLPSTIVDFTGTGGSIRVLREGRISSAQIDQALRRT